MTPDLSDYTASIVADTEALAATITDETLDTPVPSCPGWTLRDLAHHLGYIQRWARLAVVTAARPDDSAIGAPPPSGPAEAAQLRTWLLTGAHELVAAFDRLDPTAPTWHPFPVPRLAGVWPRRQAHEVAVHRWDAEHAIGAPSEPMALADDFVAEYFEVIVPRVVDRDGRRPPVGRLAVRLTDVGAAYLVDTTGGAVAFGPLPDGAGVDAEIVGTAQVLVLALWRREPATDVPDTPLVTAWLDFGGN